MRKLLFYASVFALGFIAGAYGYHAWYDRTVYFGGG